MNQSKYDKKYDRASKNLIQTYDKQILEFLFGIKIDSISPIDREITVI